MKFNDSPRANAAMIRLIFVMGFVVFDLGLLSTAGLIAGVVAVGAALPFLLVAFMTYASASFSMAASTSATSQTVTRFDNFLGFGSLPSDTHRQMVDSDTSNLDAICLTRLYCIALHLSYAFCVVLVRTVQARISGKPVFPKLIFRRS